MKRETITSFLLASLAILVRISAIAKEHDDFNDTRHELEYDSSREINSSGESNNDLYYDEKEWHDLTVNENSALSTLGWTESAWDSPVASTPIERLSWNLLTSPQRTAAQFVGYGILSWQEHRHRHTFNATVIHISIPELTAINLEYLSDLDMLVELDDGATVGDDETASWKIVTMSEYIRELRAGSTYYLKYEDNNDYKIYLQHNIEPKVLTHLGNALRDGPLRDYGYIPEEYLSGELDEINYSFWVGGTNTSTSMHYDSDYINFLWVAEGRKRVVILPNDERTEGYECQSFYENHSCWTGVDILYGKLPPHAVEVELGPGDGILFPYRSWHAVQNLEPTVAFGFRYDW